MADTPPPQRDPDVVTYVAFNGLRDDVSAERFDIGDLEAADNIDIDKTGRIARRAGYTNLVAGATHSLWADRLQDVCMLVSGGSLNRLNPDYSRTPVKALADGLSRMAFERVSERVYFSNGADIGIYENGAARSWGLPTGVLPGASAVAGGMPAGKYQFTMSWLRADGQESGSPLGGVIELPDSGGIQFALPVSAHPDVVGKLLYLSPANAETMFEAAVADNAQTSLTWLHDTSSLSASLQTQFLAAPPPGQLIAFYRGRMFVAAGDLLFMSEPYAYELFDLRRYIPLDGRITMLAPFVEKDRSVSDDNRDSGFFIGTERSCGVLAGTDATNFQYVPKTDYGAIFGALDYVDGALYGAGDQGARPMPMFLTTQGMCIGMSGLSINNLTRSKFTFPAAGRGAAVFVPGPNRFIATANF